MYVLCYVFICLSQYRPLKVVCTVKPHLQAKREIKELFSSRIATTNIQYCKNVDNFNTLQTM